MTLQMDNNRAYTPLEWLLIQKMEFEKETNLRMATKYGNFSEHIQKQVAEVRPPKMPMAVRRLPENSELPSITKGWRSRVYEPIATKRPEVREIGRFEAETNDVQPVSQLDAKNCRPAMELDNVKGKDAPEAPAGKNPFASTSSGKFRTPLLARTVVNAPERLDLSRIREVNRFPKSSSTASLSALPRTDRSFNGCRRTCSSSVIFGP
ncbi:unnamed protein product [Durusdinium trenchii]|uniref:Uncharacterized protein n=1 Tax=Durusdinium trenchii TaxID=1381693 RepID=A0ABP0SKX9_9DINO